MALYVKESGGCVRIGNDPIELGFSEENNGALVSIMDKATGCELLREGDAPAPLWRLALRRQDDKQLEWIESGEATNFEWSVEEKDDGATLILTTTGFPGRGMKVIVKVTLTAGSPLSVWRMDVQDIGDDMALYKLICPIISGLAKVGDPAPGEALAVPIQGEGYLFKNPYPVRDRLPLCSGPGPEMADVGVGKVSGLYPGSLPIQMYAFYNDKAGIYFAAHDARQNVKEFEMGPRDDWGPSPVMSMSHFPGEIPGKDVAIDYDCIVGAFHGDWCDAADIYKAWATRQWWCEKKLWDRDIADWMRKGIGGVFQMSNYHIPKLDLNHSMDQIANTVNELSSEAGVPLLGLVFNWEGNGGWTGPMGFFPPREGKEKFKAAMTKLREAGNYGFVYITGGVWYIKNTYDPPHDSWPEFEADGKANAVREPNGEVRIDSWFPGWESAWICPETEYLKDLTVSIFLDCLDLDATVVQIDNFPIGGNLPCYDPSHGHPPGFGAWRGEAWGRILADVRRLAKVKNAECAITTEGIAENFIPWLDMYDQRSGNMEYFGHYGRGMPMGGETIPIFNYVYNEYIGSYYAAYPECNRPEVLYWTRGLGKALCQGVVPTGGRYFPEPAKHNPVTIGFYKKIVRATANECWPYLMFGEMLRSLEIDVPVITAQYCKFNYDGDTKEHHMDPQQRHEVRDYAVQHAVFRGRDGTIAYFFVNISEGPVSFDVELLAPPMEAKRCDVERITDGKHEDWLHGVTLPRRESIEIKPLSVIVAIVKECRISG